MRARGRPKARIVRSRLDEKDWRPRLEVLHEFIPANMAAVRWSRPQSPERKPMVIKYVFETGGKTLQELPNFPTLVT